MSSDRIELHCSRCNGTKFQLPDHPKATDIVTCAGCGAKNTYGKLQEHAIAEAKKLVEKTFADALRKWK